MSFRRKTYDGNLPGRSAGVAERRSTVSRKSETIKYAPPKRANGNARLVSFKEEEHTEETNSKDRYLITYADLITLLLGLFIILYAMSKIDVEKYEGLKAAFGSFFGTGGEVSVLPGPATPINEITERTLKQELQELIKANNYESSIRLQENERGITIHIMDKILFSSGSADLSSDSRVVLHSLAGLLRKLPNDIRIEGHTDNVPISNSVFQSNWHLSVARALNTAYYLIQHESLNPDKVSIVGYSEYNPIASNETAEGREINRRVDLVIIKK